MGSNYKAKRSKIASRLSSRLLMLVCVTFLPLNISMLILSGVIFYNSAQEITNSWQREIHSAVSNMETTFENIENDMSFFIAEYLYRPSPEQNAPANIVNMVYDLGEIYTDAALPGFLYLEDKQNNKMYIKYDPDSHIIGYTEDAIDNLRNYPPIGTSGMWFLTYLNNRYYYCRYYEYSYFRLGVYIDMEEAFSHVHSSDSQIKDTFLISDGNLVLQRSESGFTPVEQSNWVEATKSSPTTRWIIWNAKKLSLSAGIGIHYFRFFELVPTMCWFLIFVAMLSFSLVFFIWRSLQNQVVKPLQTLQHGLEELEAHNMAFRLKDSDKIKTEELTYLYEAFNLMADEVSSSHEKDIKMYQTELDNLRLQVNPHMLLNSYNMIYSLAQTQNYTCIQEYTLHLADYFRYVLRENNTFVKLSREMQFISSYIAIQEIRFPGAFVSTCNVTEAAEQALIPPLLVENFVENAMKYAMIPGQVIHVDIKAWKDYDRLHISIEDNGNGMKPEVLKCINQGKVYVDQMGHKHIGIHNCRRRMELFYRGGANLKITSAVGKGTKIFLDLPYLLNPEDLENGGIYHEIIDRR